MFVSTFIYLKGNVAEREGETARCSLCWFTPLAAVPEAELLQSQGVGASSGSFFCKYLNCVQVSKDLDHLSAF